MLFEYEIIIIKTIFVLFGFDLCLNKFINQIIAIFLYMGIFMYLSW